MLAAIDVDDHCVVLLGFMVHFDGVESWAFSAVERGPPTVFWFVGL